MRISLRRIHSLTVVVQKSLLLCAVAAAQAPDAPISRAAPPVVIRKTVQTTDGRTLEGVVLTEGITDLQLRTDDKTIRLLRKADGGKFPVVTSQADWPTHQCDPSG